MAIDLDEHRRYLYAGKSCTKLEDFPAEEHLAVVILNTVSEHNYYDADDPTNITVCEYRTFADAQELRGWIQVNYLNSNKTFNFVVLRAIAKTPKINIELDLSL